MTVRTAAVDSSSPPPPWPRLSASRSAISTSARRNASMSRRPASAIRRSAAKLGHPQALLDLRGRLAGGERLGDRERVAQAADHVVQQPRERSPWPRSSIRSRVAALRSPADDRVGERPDLALDGARAGLLDLLDADRRALPVLERELLELPEQPLLAVADLGEERPGGLVVELEPELGGALGDPARELARLDLALLGDLAAGGR